MSTTFPWKRFWCSPSEEIFLDELGFLNKPRQYTNPNIKSFEEIQQTPCLVLHGEPGIDKSQAIKDDTHNIEDYANILSLDLKRGLGYRRHILRIGE